MKKLIPLQTQDIAQSVVHYINANNQVCAHAVAISNTVLPSLTVPPDNYGTFVEIFAGTKLHVMSWIKEIVLNFNMLPTMLVNYNRQFQQQMAAILGYLNQLQTAYDTGTVQKIKDALKPLQAYAKESQDTVSALDTMMSSYQNNIVPDATRLSGLSTQIATAEKADKAAIEKLNKVISGMQKIVDDRNEIETLNKVENITEGIFIGAVGVGIGCAITGPAGVVIGIGLAIGSTIFTAYISIGDDIGYRESLDSIQKDMDRVTAEIGGINTAIGMLQSLDTHFKDIVAKSTNAAQKIKTVLSFWQKIELDAQHVVAELDKILTDTNARNFTQAITDVNAAIVAWNDIDSYMKKIKAITFNVNTDVYIPASARQQAELAV